MYGTIIWDDLGRSESGPIQRNITVFADGEVDRSPCGSGTGARVALLADDGTLGANETLEHRSIVDSVFTASWVAGADRPDGTTTVIPSVTGTAYLTGEQAFTLDPADTLGTGFTLR
nr:proline racemase family protein [Leucobacter denitrificans]